MNQKSPTIRAQAPLREPPLSPEMRAALDAMDDCCGLYVAIRDDSGKIVDFEIAYVNPAACLNNRLLVEEQLGRRLTEILPTHVSTGLLGAYCRVVDTGEPFIRDNFGFEDEYGGQEEARSFSIRATRFGDGFFATWRRTEAPTTAGPSWTEIERREFAEAELRNNELFYRQTVQSIPGMAFTCAPDGPCEYLSQQWLEYTGRSPQDVLEYGWLEDLHPDDRERAIVTWHATLRGEAEYDIEYRIRRHDGVYEWFVARGRPIRDEHGKVARWFGVAINIQELKQTQAALEASQQRFVHAAEAVSGIIYEHDFTTGHVERSRGLYEVTGHRVEEAEPTVDWWREQMHPDDRARLSATFERDIRGNRIAHEYRIRHRDGHWVDVYDQGLVIRERGRPVKLVGCTVDITARKRTEEALRRSEMIHRRLAEANLFGVGFGDSQGNVSYVNDEMLRMMGCTRADFDSGRINWKTALAPEHRQAAREMLSRLQAGGPRVTYEREFLRPDGQRTPFLGAAAIVEPGSDFHVSIALDLTAARAAEAQLRKSRDELEQRVAERTAELEAKNQHLRQLGQELTEAEQRERRKLASMLHDGLQQLLVASKMQLSLCEGGENPAGIERVGQLLDESLAASRSLAYELSPPAFQTSKLPAALEWLRDWFADHHRFQVELRVRNPIPKLEESLKTFLFHAVRELLLNAVKHSGVDRAEVLLEQPTPGRARIVVSDAGRGFDADGVGPVDEEHGNGLGLAAIRERLAAFGGRLEVEASLGQGSRFVMEAPTTAPQAIEAHTTATKKPSRSRPPKVRPRTAASPRERDEIRVLLVDDHDIFRQGLASLMQGAPELRVIGEAANGRDAVEQAERLAPDVVLMDINMPEMDGIEATRRITQMLPDAIVVGLSLHPDADHTEEMLQAGASAYHCKSDGGRDLIDAIKALGRREAGDRSVLTRILLVEDTPMVAMATRRLLEKLDDVEVETAVTGAEALAAIRRAAPDMLLLDLGLPDLSGEEVAREIRGDAELGRIRICALTAQQGEAVDAPDLFDHFLEKPVDLEQLRQVVTCL